MNTLAVHRWPGSAPAPQDGLFAILIDTRAAPHGSAEQAAGTQRDAARRQIRLAAREALAAVLRVPIDDIAIASSPGTPPRILLAGAPSHIGISIAHEEHYALAAINLHGAIGADIMRVQEIPATVSALESATNRPAAFAAAWTQREAGFKLHAQALTEWQAELPGAAISLNLPENELAGTIYIN
jgi:4'-phosphopantetheinyl transferase